MRITIGITIDADLIDAINEAKLRANKKGKRFKINVSRICERYLIQHFKPLFPDLFKKF
jgi:hypothetical protein